jgi:uncharacterized protein involved in response to NO
MSLCIETIFNKTITYILYSSFALDLDNNNLLIIIDQVTKVVYLFSFIIGMIISFFLIKLINKKIINPKNLKHFAITIITYTIILMGIIFLCKLTIGRMRYRSILYLQQSGFDHIDFTN